MSLDLYFAGAEVPTRRRLLVAEGREHVCVNTLHLRPRLGKKEWRLADYFPPDVSIFLDSGAAGTPRRRWNAGEHTAYLVEYVAFVPANLDRLDYFTEYDAMTMGQDWIEQQRQDAWTGINLSKFVPVWHEEHGAPPAPMPILPGRARSDGGARAHSSGAPRPPCTGWPPPRRPRRITSAAALRGSRLPARGDAGLGHHRLRRYPSEDMEGVALAVGPGSPVPAEVLAGATGRCPATHLVLEG